MNPLSEPSSRSRFWGHDPAAELPGREHGVDAHADDDRQAAAAEDLHQVRADESDINNPEEGAGGDDLPRQPCPQTRARTRNRMSAIVIVPVTAIPYAKASFAERWKANTRTSTAANRVQ